MLMNASGCKSQKGFSLVELMISMLIGLVLIGGLFSFYISFNQSAMDAARNLRLTQDMRSALSFISREVRRAGYSSEAHLNLGGVGYCNPMSSDCKSGKTLIQAASDRIEFSYDAPGSSGFAFYLQDGVIMYQFGAGVVEPLTDPGSTVYTRLEFSPSYCDVLEDPPDDGNGCDPDFSSLRDEADLRIVSIDIVLTGVPANGSDAFERTITRSVRVRNDHYHP